MESHTHAWERFAIGILLFLFHQPLTIGDECAPGINSHGYTTPQGDLRIRTGRDLIINCTLKPDEVVQNASQIHWMLDKQKVNATSVHVLNDNTAQLRILNVQKSNFKAFCKWNNYDICRNVVYVGDPPAANLPINCTSYDFNKITCQWPSVKDDVLHAGWTLQQDINPRLSCSNRISTKLDGQSLTGNFCLARKPCILLNVTNKIGNNSSWLEFDQYRNLVLSAPGKLKVNEVAERRAKISWDYNERHNICAKTLSRAMPKTCWIDYKLTVKKKNDREGIDSFEVNTTGKWYLLEDLMPHTEYDVEIQGRFVYEGYKNAWSQSNSVKFDTKPDIPTALPSNLVAEISLDSQERNVTLYWTGIPKGQQAGEDFCYSVNTSWNNSDPMVNKTMDTYLRLTNLSRELAYTFTVQAENEVGIATKGSYYYIKKDEVQESLALVIDDIIVNVKNSDTWNYSLSWNSSDEKIYDLALYWCRGNTSNGLIQCDDSGIHFHKTVSSKDSNYTFSLPNPFPQSHYFGFVANESSRSPRILWGSCVIPTSRDPHPPTLNKPSNNGTTWVYLTWEHPKCERKAAYTSGYKICVYYTGEKKELVNYTVKENVTAFNVTNLSPRTVYTFGISTIIPNRISSEAVVTVTTPPSPTKPDQTDVLVIIFPTAILAVLLLWGSYVLYKRISRRIQDATKIDLPSKLTAKHPQDALVSGDQNHNKEDYILDNSVSGTFIHNKRRYHYKMPLFIKPPTNVKDPRPTSRNGSNIDRFDYSGCMTDDLLPVSSPVESNGSQGSSPDSGFDPETPTTDVDDATFDFEDRLNEQEDWIDSPKGYSKAIVLAQRPPFAKVEEQSCASNDGCEIPADYSIVGITSVPASPAVESHKNHSQALSVNSYRLPKTSKDAKQQLFSAPTVLTVFEAESDRAQVDSDVGVRVVHVPESSKSEKMPTDPQNIPLNSVGYAQLSFAVDQPVSSQGMSDDGQLHAENKDGYTKVAMAVDDFQSSPSSTASSEHQQVIPTCCVGLQPPTISISRPDSSQVNSANGYKRLNESNLVSTSSPAKDSLLNIQPGSTTTCNETTAASEDTAEPLSCRTMTTGYVSAVNLSV